MREPSPATVYIVRWPEHSIVKVGYTDASRWRIFEPRGGEVIALQSFPNALLAVRHEAKCHEELGAVYAAAFHDRKEAMALGVLGSQGYGYTECFTVPASVPSTEVLALCSAGEVVADGPG